MARFGLGICPPLPVPEEELTMSPSSMENDDDDGPDAGQKTHEQSSSSLPGTPLTSPSVLRRRRHYKKDSRYLLDLYTLTFDEDETVDDVAPCKTMLMATTSMATEPLSMSFSASSSDALPSSGPMSLQSNYGVKGSVSATLPSLETNLHKILARKIQDSEEMTFRKAKLLTKAYYMLLRGSSSIPSTASNNQLQPVAAGRCKRIGEGRLSWQTLLSTDFSELRRTVRGLGNAIKALNDYLVELLVERDGLLGQQDDMLEEISELTDSLL